MSNKNDNIINSETIKSEENNNNNKRIRKFKNNKRTILVTGATGTVGSEVVKQLLASPSSRYDIRAAIHSKKGADKIRRYQGIETVEIDYDKPDTLATAFKGVEKLFLLTVPKPDMEDISFNVVKEAKKNCVSYIVKLSAEVADAELGTIIGRLHRREEKIIEESGIPYTFLRPTSFMQNIVNFFGHTIKTQNAFYLPLRNGKVSFVDVRDVATVAVAVLLTENNETRQQYVNKVYHITGQEALSCSQAAEILSKVIGRKISYIDIPEEGARKGMRVMGMEDWFIDAMIELYNIIRAGYASQTTTVVEKITGRKPISFEQFVRDYTSSF